jgi:armadillo repeat-containing protein 7
MFSTPSSLKRRTGKDDLDRPSYLKQLYDEYNNSKTDITNQEQILANLANFAYDPINYEYFRRFNILSIFVDNLKRFQQQNFIFIPQCEDESSNYLSVNKLEFSVASICNLCLDKKNQSYLLENKCVEILIKIIINSERSPPLQPPIIAKSKVKLNWNDEVILNSITTILFLFYNNTKNDSIINNDIFSKNDLLVQFIKQAIDESETRLSNLAKIFHRNLLS